MSSSSSSSSNLERLLSLSNVLKKGSGTLGSGSGSGSSGSNLTLKQLIAVHESLLDSVSLDSTATGTRTDTDTDTTPSRVTERGDSDIDMDSDIGNILVRCGVLDNEMTMCQKILSMRNADVNVDVDAQDILLVVQYLLRLRCHKVQATIASEGSAASPSSSPSSVLMILDGLQNVTFPLLLSCAGRWGQSQYDNLLRDAILDASFISSRNSGQGEREGDDGGASDNNRNVATKLQQCLDVIYSSTLEVLNTKTTTSRTRTQSQNANEIGNNGSVRNANVINTIVEMSSRILTRILSVVDECDCESKGTGMDGTDEDISSMPKSMPMPMRELVLDTMHNLTMAIVNALCFHGANDNDGSGTGVGNNDVSASASVSASTALVINGMATTFTRPITALLLPALFERKGGDDAGSDVNVNVNEHYLRRLNQLWEIICTLMDHSNSEGNVMDDHNQNISNSNNSSRRKCRNFPQVANSVVSGLLCALVGNIHSLPLVIPHHCKGQEQELADDAAGRVRIIHHPSFWTFVKMSLTSGENISIGTDNRGMKGGGNFTSRMATSTGDGKGKAGSSFSSSQQLPESLNPYQDVGMEDYDVDQMVRRRAIHILRTVIDREYDALQKERKSSSNKKSSKSKSSKSKTTKSSNTHGDGAGSNATISSNAELFKSVELWKKYILCFETLEIEVEAHLVDQVYPTVTELCAACVEVDVSKSSKRGSGPGSESSFSLPKISWEWVASIFSRVLLSDSPTLRKLGLYRLFSGKAGISLNSDDVRVNANTLEVSTSTPMQDPHGADKKKKAPTSSKQAKKQAKMAKKKGKGTGREKLKAQPAPIRIVSPSFVLYSLIHSYDSLSTSVGTGINVEGDDGKTSNDDLQKLLPTFLKNYTKSLFTDDAGRQRLTDLIEGMLSERFISATRAKNLVLVYDSILDAWNDESTSTTTKINLSRESLESAVTAYRKLFNSGSVVFDYRQSLLLNLSKILALSHFDEKRIPAPLSILKVLSLYPVAEEFNQENDFDAQTKSNLSVWLNSFGDNWTSNVGAACASAFVSGDMIPFSGSELNGLISTSSNEREVGSSIAKMCTLACDSPSLLWPAISKGLSSISPFGQQLLPMTPEMGQKAARALILFIGGCKERILSGIGHGDLVLDKHGNMMPPPPNVELLISRAASLALNQLNIVSICNFDEELTNCVSESHASNDFANIFIMLIDQLMVLKKSFPSSVIMENALEKLLRSSIDSLLRLDKTWRENSSAFASKDCVDLVKHISTAYGVLSAGAKLRGVDSSTEDENEVCNDLVNVCSSILKMDFKTPPRIPSSALTAWQVKGMRSIFQHAKWGSLMHLMPMAYQTNSIPMSTFRSLHNDVFDIVLDSVNATPASALPTLFETAVISAKNSFQFDDDKEGEDDSQLQFSQNMAKIIETFFAIMNDTEQNSTRAFMLSVTCGLIFRPRLLAEEFSALRNIKERDGKYSVKRHAPILRAFRKLVKDAGSQKSHILKYAMSYISVGWLGDQEDKSKTGLPAIPYREDIAKLLVHKEVKFEESSVHQEGLVKSNNDEEAIAATLLPGVPRTSVTRCFLLIFLSKLPDIHDMSEQVASELCHFLIFWLLDEVCLPVPNGQLKAGSTEYVQKIRAWQTLCVMARFVTPDIAPAVMTKTFKAMSQVLHGQIRYFIEVFTIQIAKVDPVFWVKLFKTELLRYDISQQHVSSLMIIGGYLIVGKDSESFIKLITNPDKNNKITILHEIIAGVLPWLGSTQGFCRAIAQLLIHKLMPLADTASLIESDAFFLKSISTFLDNNPEMTRLRKKQFQFFETYSLDQACHPEGIFSFDIDEVAEANPPHLVETLKKCLVDIYNETHPTDTPEWKMLEEEIGNISLVDDSEGCLDVDGEGDDSSSALVNFQRKIVPVDSLNISLESQKQATLRNAAGRDRQSLIVCASLIDKATNLAGLTRTAEIFAASRIIVPDITVKKMDNFKSISVGAEEWIEMEECKEKDLLCFLKKYKEEGYRIIGIEQTSSSRCLSNVKFEEKTLLLLGKEKEGIPVEYLQLVDRCVEIPQLGIIRSLNVHVSGAISIWEYTKQQMTNVA